MTLHQQQVLFKVLNDYESKIANKDKLIKSQAYDCSEYLKIIKRNADERQTQLKKSDFEYYYDCEYCGRLSEGQQCEKSYYDNECFRYHDETHIY
ncbi:hypothetical protein [Spiroplasma endosymbiont of Ammophila pubescens]|uniref:hypothetical protein n=1 Tax=Spiroplasma endosymbiont of Ammophila pubescens TaxID=3066315 RepID=UPI0032B2D879